MSLIGTNTNGEFIKELADEYEQPQYVDDLAVFVAEAAFKARNHRQSIGIDCRLAQALNAVNCRISPVAQLDDLAVHRHTPLGDYHFTRTARPKTGPRH